MGGIRGRGELLTRNKSGVQSGAESGVVSGAESGVVSGVESGVVSGAETGMKRGRCCFSDSFDGLTPPHV